MMWLQQQRILDDVVNNNNMTCQHVHVHVHDMHMTCHLHVF